MCPANQFAGLKSSSPKTRIITASLLFNVVPKYCQAQARPPQTAGAKQSRRQIEKYHRHRIDEMSDSRVLRKRLPEKNGSTMQHWPSTLGILPYVVHIAMVVYPARYPSLCPLSCLRTQAPSPIYSTPPTTNHPDKGRPTTHPTLMDVNLESGSIIGGARIWLKGKTSEPSSLYLRY